MLSSFSPAEKKRNKIIELFWIWRGRKCLVTSVKFFLLNLFKYQTLETVFWWFQWLGIIPWKLTGYSTRANNFWEVSVTERNIHTKGRHHLQLTKNMEGGGLRVTFYHFMINLEGEITNTWLSTFSIWFIKLSFILFWFRWCPNYLFLLFFTLSVQGGRGKVNDTNFTLSAVFPK